MRVSRYTKLLQESATHGQPVSPTPANQDKALHFMFETVHLQRV